MPALAAVHATVREREYRVQALNQQDLDRNFALPTTHLFKWMQAARMDLPWLGPGYRGLGALEPPSPRRLLVGAQMIRLLRPGLLAEAAGQKVAVRCEVGAVGRTSIEFRYRILFGERLVGTGSTTMIVVSGAPGSLKPSPVPEAVRRLAAHDEGAGDRALLAASLAALAREPPAGAFSHSLVVRFSDEDVNRHANHSALARFFEDAREAILADEAAGAELRAVAAQQLEAILIAYEAEARATDRCEVRVTASGQHALDLWVLRTEAGRSGGRPGPIGRGRMLCGGGRTPDPEEARIGAKL